MLCSVVRLTMSKKRQGNYQRKWDTESCKQFIRENDIDVELLSEYVDMYTKMDFRCSCGNIFSTNWHEFNNKKFPKRQCNKCGRNRGKAVRQRITCKTIRGYLKENEYTCKLISNEYINCDSKLEFECECGNHFFASWSNIKHMSGLCKKCAMRQITHEQFMDRILKWLNDFEILNKYDTQDDYIDIRCKKCGAVFSRMARHVYDRGICCPHCTGSKGELYISEYLLKNNINFIPQYKFDDCANINPLPFDFYLPDYNVAIEFQGLQHYEPVDYFGGKERFEQQKMRDEIKKKYCQEKCIVFIEISYMDFNNIDDILDSFFMSYKEVV